MDFSSLPPELRHEIWRLVFSTPAVWTITADSTHFSTAFLGPAPPLAGLVCREAYYLLQETHTRIMLPSRGHRVNEHENVGTSMGIFINVHWTIIDITNLRDQPAVWRWLRDEDWAKFHHFTWARRLHGKTDPLRLLMRFQRWLSPALRTIIVRDDKGGRFIDPGSPPVEMSISYALGNNSWCATQLEHRLLEELLKQTEPVPPCPLTWTELRRIRGD